MSSDGIVGDIHRCHEHNRAVVASLTRQQEAISQRLAEAAQNVIVSEEKLVLLEEQEKATRNAKFIQDLNDRCFICQSKFSDKTGLPSFSVTSLWCPRCTGNARMVHLTCWSSVPPGREKCGSCQSPVHLVDNEGNALKLPCNATAF